jgi:hypothetical protein
MSARDQMIQRLSHEKEPPAVQRDRARRHASAVCDSASQVLLLSRTIQRLGAGRAFTTDAKIDSAIQRVMGGRQDPTRGGRAAKKQRAAHAEATELLAQLKGALDVAPVDALNELSSNLGAALETLEQAIEALI